MKKIITLLFLSSIAIQCMSQRVEASLGIGDQPNRIKIYIKSNVAINNLPVTSLQFDLAFPSTVQPVPQLSFASFGLPGNWLFSNVSPYVEPLNNPNSYRHFEIVKTGSPFLTLPANTEFEVMQLEVTNWPVIPSDVYLITLGVANPCIICSGNGGGLTENAMFYFNIVGVAESQEGFLYYDRPDEDKFGKTFTTTILNNNSYTGPDSSFAKLNSGILLPVNFLGFEVINNGNLANLKWSVEGEDANTKLYEVQSSSDGVNFKTFATVAAKGNGSNTYSLNDVALNAGVNYYRIKQVDKDGKFALSPVRSLTLGGKSGGVSVFPNPAINTVKTTVSLSKKGAYTVIISNAAGQVVSTQKYGGNKGDNIESINLSNLADGTYNFKFITDEGTKVVPVVKSK